MKLIELEQHSKIESKAHKIRAFDQICLEIPECIVEVKNEKSSPNWGRAWYQRDKDGLISLFKENWDTSG